MDERANGFYWIRYTPDSIWMPAMWDNGYGWFIPGVDCGFDDTDRIVDDKITEIGDPIDVPTQYRRRIEMDDTEKAFRLSSSRRNEPAGMPV